MAKLKILTKKYEGLTAFYRKGESEEGSSDESALAEVVERRTYRKPSLGFDVLPEETWLDLGANIGSFALYCRLRGAKAICYEPDPACFKLLQKNAPNFELHNAAVTASKSPEIQFFKSSNPENFYRGTILEVKGYIPLPPVANIYAGTLKKLKVDGIKMDIEGSEGALIDLGLLPKCRKLVLEYHTSRDSSVHALRHRLALLSERFAHVHYPKAYSEAIASGQDTYRPRFDQLIFCWND